MERQRARKRLALRDAFHDPCGACFYGGNTGIMKEIAGRPIG